MPTLSMDDLRRLLIATAHKARNDGQSHKTDEQIANDVIIVNPWIEASTTPAPVPDRIDRVLAAREADPTAFLYDPAGALARLHAAEPEATDEAVRVEGVTLTVSVHSDDCASISGLKESEYDVPGTWYPLLVDGNRVGQLRANYGHGDWEFEIKPDDGHSVAVVVLPATGTKEGK